MIHTIRARSNSSWRFTLIYNKMRYMHKQPIAPRSTELHIGFWMGNFRVKEKLGLKLYMNWWKNKKHRILEQTNTRWKKRNKSVEHTWSSKKVYANKSSGLKCIRLNLVNRLEGIRKTQTEKKKERRKIWNKELKAWI